MSLRKDEGEKEPTNIIITYYSTRALSVRFGKYKPALWLE